MGLFLPEGYCNLHFIASDAGAKEVTFALAFQLIDPTIVSLEGAYDAFAEFGPLIGWPSSIEIRGVRAETGTAVPNEPLLEEFFGSANGSGSSALLPPQCSWLVKKTSAMGGRKNRGRVYIPFPQEADVDSQGNAASGKAAEFLGYLQDFGTAVFGAIEASSPVILHTDPDDTPTPATGFVWESKIATQRRRFER